MILNGAQFRQQLNSLKGQANTASTKISSSFKKVGAALAATFSTAAIVSFGKSCIKLGSDLAEVQNVVDVTFTSMSNSVNEWAKNATKSYGLSETMAKKYVGLYGTMSRQYGFTEKQAYDMSTTLAGLAGDVASYYNITQDEAYTKLKAVFSGETEVLKDIGIVMTQNALDAYALANGYGKTTAKMSEMEKVSLRYNFILTQLKSATGDFVRTQDNWANQTRILTLRFDSLKATLGQGLINVFTPVIKVVNSLIERLTTVSEKFKALTERIFGNAGGSSGGTTNAAIADTVNSAENLTNEANNSSAALDSVADSAEKAKRSVAGFDKLNILSKETKTETTSSTQPATQTTVGSNGLASSMSKSVDRLVSSWNSKGQKVIDSMKKAFNSVKGAVQSIGKSWSNVWNNGSGKKLLDNIKLLLSNIFDNVGSIAGAFKKAWDNAGLGNQVVQSIIDRANSLIELINTIAEDFNEVWNNGVGERIWSNILEIIKNCNNWTTTLRNKIKEAWDKNDAGKRIWGTILGIVEDITEFLKDMSEIRLEWLESLDLSPITEAVADLGEAFRELLKACGDKLKTVYENILLPLAKWTIEKAVPKLVELLAGAFELLGKFIKKIPVSVLTGVAAAIGTIVAAFKAFKIAQEVKKNFDKIKAAFLGFKDKILQHPYAALITAIATAVIGVISAMKEYSNEQWSNSSLKKEIDKTTELTEKWSDLADEMSTEIEEINDTELTMKVDFENVDKMKERLKEIIEDGTIDESEEGDYRTIVDLLGDKVDGFTEDWNTLTLEEVDGKIVIKDNIDEVNQKLDDLVTNWEITQAKLTFGEIYSNLQTDVEKKKIDIDVEDKNNYVDKDKKELIDYIYRKSNLSKKESELLTNELIKQKGDFEKTNESLINQFENGSISGLEYENLFSVFHNGLGRRSIGRVFGWNYDDVSEHVKETIDNIDNLNEQQSRNKDTYDELVDTMDEYESVLSTINGGSKNYNDYIKLSTEYGLSHDAVLSLLKDDGITTWEELESAAKKSSDETNKSLDKTDGKWQESSAGVAKSAHSAADTVEKCTVKAKSSVDSNLAEGVPKSISTMWQRIKSVFTDGDGFVKIKDAIWGVFKNAINELISGINSLIRKPFDMLNDAFDNVRNFEVFGLKVFDWLPKIEAPQIPKLAKGAIVKAPTLAVVGDNAGANTGNPEVVAPLNKLQSMINTSSGQDAVILTQMLDYLKRIYEMFVVFRNNGGNTYQFVAKMNGSVLFEEIINQNEFYKKRHNGKSAFA